jgi:mono/diheme cytochrome c family protein
MGLHAQASRLALAIWLALMAAALAQDNATGRVFSPGYRFAESGGEELFANICQGCHMPDALGATGAGSYPSLSNNPNLAASGYPVYLVVRGRRAMPPFGDMLSDDQIAAVVNYVRSHFGNSYSDAVTARDVRNVRR